MSTRVFKRTADVTAGQPAEFSGFVLPQDVHRPAIAILTIRTGAAETTLYPCADTLDALANDLHELASAVRAMRTDQDARAAA